MDFNALGNSNNLPTSMIRFCNVKLWCHLNEFNYRSLISWRHTSHEVKFDLIINDWAPKANNWAKHINAFCYISICWNCIQQIVLFCQVLPCNCMGRLNVWGKVNLQAICDHKERFCIEFFLDWNTLQPWWVFQGTDRTCGTMSAILAWPSQYAIKYVCELEYQQKL